MSLPFSLNRIHHVAYRCKDAKQTADWYRDNLGMEFTTAFSEDYVPSTGAYDPYMHIFLDCGGGNVIGIGSVQQVGQSGGSASHVGFSGGQIRLGGRFQARCGDGLVHQHGLVAVPRLEQHRQGGSRTVLLTRVGGGVFGNEQDWIDDAIERALGQVANCALDVRLVSAVSVNPAMVAIAERWSAAA